MISKAEIKLLRSLGRKSVRNSERLFVAEGHKAISELMDYFACSLLVGTADELHRLPSSQRAERIEEVPNDFAFERISSLDTPRNLLAVFRMNEAKICRAKDLTAPALLLDGIQDPGNIGTIIRTANWFGIHTILSSRGTADIYASKVVQACMGALAGIDLYPLSDTIEYLQEAQAIQIPIIGTFLEAPSLYQTELPPTSSPAILVLGNEGQGISPEVATFCDLRLHIPAGKHAHRHTESLNVAIATAIILAHWQAKYSD